MRTVPDDLSRDNNLGKRLVCQLEMRVRLIVLEHDVEPRLVFFYEIGFEHESLDLAVDDDEFEIGNMPDELARFWIEVSAGLEILSYAAAKVLGLADIDDLAVGIFVQINAGRFRDLFELFLKSHRLEFSVLGSAYERVMEVGSFDISNMEIRTVEMTRSLSVSNDRSHLRSYRKIFVMYFLQTGRLAEA